MQKSEERNDGTGRGVFVCRCEAEGLRTYHASEAAGAEEAGAAALAVDGPGGEVFGVLQVHLLAGVGGAAPAGLAAVDPGREVAVLVWPHIVLLASSEDALEVELELGGGAHALRQVPCTHAHAPDGLIHTRKHNK